MHNAPPTPETIPPIGHLEGNTHVLPVRVYYQDTDAEGVVYHANYFHYAERARVEFMRCLGADLQTQQGHDVLAFAVRSCAVDFLRPARLDDVLAVRSRIARVGGASLAVEQIIRRDGADVARLEVRLVAIGPDGRPLRLPGPIRAALEGICRPPATPHLKTEEEV